MAAIIASAVGAADFDQLAAGADVIEQEARRQHADPEDDEEADALVQREGDEHRRAWLAMPMAKRWS